MASRHHRPVSVGGYSGADSDDDNYSQTSQNSNSSDDSASNAADAAAAAAAKTDSLLSALDDLQGRIVHSLDTFQHHLGTRSSPNVSIHVELQEILKPVLEIAAHTAPSIARTYAPLTRPSIDAALEEVYTKINSDLILPVLRMSALSETSAPKRAAALAFFPMLWREWRVAGSWLDVNDFTGLGGLYGKMNKGQSLHHHDHQGGGDVSLSSKTGQAAPEVKKSRLNSKSIRTAELLRYWIEGATACTVPGSFTDERSEGSIVSRAVISSGAVVRPALKLIVKKISEADDAGALKLYLPVMRMISGVLTRLFNDGTAVVRGDDGLKSACIKFLEIVVLCFSSRSTATTTRGRGAGQGGATPGDDFALNDLPSGHPVITKQALEEIGEDAFTILRGLLMIGGQVKVDLGVKRDIMMDLGLDSSGSGSPSAQIGATLKPAALSYLEVESSQADPDHNSEQNNATPKALDRSNLELDFDLSHKSYAVTINAIAMLAIHRPMFFQDSATCLARRTLDPPPIPSAADTNDMDRATFLRLKSTNIAIRSHLKASSLTLLRNTLSLTTNSSAVLHTALISSDMKIQADKALKKAQDDLKMKNSSRSQRNKAAIYYEWDQSATSSNTMDDLTKKRHRAGDDALERMRQAKAARGLGNGIHLPTSMADAVELIFTNLTNLPSSKSVVTAGLSTEEKKKASLKKRTTPMTLDFVIDAVMTSGASLLSDESRWYKRDGGNAWMMDVSTYVSDDETDDEDNDMTMATGEEKVKKRTPAPVTFTLDTKAFEANDSNKKKKESEEKKLYEEQCKLAASDAFSRIMSRACTARERPVSNFGNQIAARLAWNLKGVKPSGQLGDMYDTVSKDIDGDTKMKDKLNSFVEEFPLVTPCFALDMQINANKDGKSFSSIGDKDTLTNCILNEAYLEDESCTNKDKPKQPRYEQSLSLYVSSVLHACQKADDKPNNSELKKIGSTAAAALQQQLVVAPTMTVDALELTSGLCDIDAITKKNTEATSRKNQNIAASAAINVAKAAAEKRAIASLLTLRDIAFQFTKDDVRQSAVDCVVGIAAGRLPASAAIDDKVLKLVMNAIYPKSPKLAEMVITSATKELERTAAYAIENYDKIQKANEENNSKKSKPNPNLHQSDEEKKAIDYVQKSVKLCIALCKRKPELIEVLFKISSQKKADVLAKAVKKHMKLLARVILPYGAASIALKVAKMVGSSEVLLFLALLDKLVPNDGKSVPGQDLIDACHTIQEQQFEITGKKDPRFIVPVVSGMSRESLVEKLPEFVGAEDVVFKAALCRMSESLGKYALMFRDETNTDGTSTLKGMTLCEQMVYLHRMNFTKYSLPQKRYLDAIRICLNDDEIFIHSVIKAALDYISGTFLEGQNLPLAYMRTIILTCTKYDSLHPWICNVLLPRLIEGEVYTDRRQWEGWMRCAKMLENTEDNTVSSIGAIQSLPEEQYRMYRTKYPQN